MSMEAAGQANPIRVGLIGCGAIAEIFYAPALTELNRRKILQVSCLVDPSPERLAILDRFFPACERCSSPQDMQSLPDMAIVASPVAHHARQTVELLERGIHVLCEKPMAANTAECHMMIAAARRTMRLLGVGLFRRFFPAAQEIAALVRRRTLGELRSFSIVEGSKFQWRAKSDSLFRRAAAGGGVLIDVGVHALDLALWWFGEPLSIDYQDDAMGGVEANCSLQLRFAGGLCGEMRLSREWNLRSRYHIQFDRGWVAWTPGEANQLLLGGADGRILRAAVHSPSGSNPSPNVGALAASFQQSFTQQIENFVRACAGVEPLRVPGEEGIRSLEWIERCYRTRRLVDMPWLSERERSAAQRLSCAQ